MTENRNAKIGGILLAAGGSSRLGRPKQLVEFSGVSLIRRAAEALALSGCDPVIVVLGAEIERSTEQLEGLTVNVCINERWQDGLSSSIKAGISELIKIAPDAEAAMITLCDQPRVTAGKVRLFIENFSRTAAPAVAAAYGDTIGVPALFSKQLFPELMLLEGDKGARELLRIRIASVESIELEEATVDIDTEADISLALTS